ncbi:MAG: glycosyltransferase family 2 protein, partial [Candidatus Desulforudis sp.]|nr:glycosyltransferase family 2 protein [Desulforudis sp.]
LEVHGYLEAQDYPFEIIAVNDGSQDGTGEIIDAFAGSHHRVRPMHLALNRGKGYAVRRGVLAAQGGFIAFTDSDLSTPVEEIGRLLDHLQHWDFVIGSRALRESTLLQRQPFFRELGGKALNLAIRMAVLPGIRDTQCGFKGFGRGPGQAVFARCTVNRFAFDLEVLWLAGKLGFTVKEMPVTWINDPDSRVRPIRDAFDMLKLIARLRFSRNCR